ncbi:MAG: helix-turn-helix transcriptional regulator [Leptospirales bacterium]
MQTNPNAPIESLLEAIGENLKQRAKQAHLNQKDLAHLSDLNRNTISAALSGKDIKLSTLIRLTRETGFTEWLLPFLEQPTPSPFEYLSKTKKRFVKEKTRQYKPSSRKMGRQKG